MTVAGLLKEPSSGNLALLPSGAAISEAQAVPQLTANNSNLPQMQQKGPGEEGKTYLLPTERCH